MTEQVVRLENGFPTTGERAPCQARALVTVLTGGCDAEHERKEFERKQEANMKKLAEHSGFNISRKKDAVKLRPNAPCQCGSGKKQKKCCGLNMT